MVNKILAYDINLTASATGAATEYSNHCARGKVKAIHINYSAASAVGTVITVYDQFLLQLATNTGATDIWFYPTAIAQTNAGASMTYDGTRTVPTDLIIFGLFKVVMATNTAAETVKVTVYVEEF